MQELRKLRRRSDFCTAKTDAAIKLIDSYLSDPEFFNSQEAKWFAALPAWSRGKYTEEVIEMCSFDDLLGRYIQWLSPEKASIAMRILIVCVAERLLAMQIVTEQWRRAGKSIYA